MRLDGGLRDHQLAGDLGIGRAAGHPDRDLALPLAERVQPAAGLGCLRVGAPAGVAADQLVGVGRRQDRLPAGDDAHALDDLGRWGVLEQEAGRAGLQRPEDVLVEVECPEDLPAVQLDANQIKQAFFNVIRNAIQALTNGGLLKISVASTDRFVSISFKDTGPGIAPEELSQIFEAHHTTKSEGSGLGLMIVQRIVRDHGGQIEVHSEPRIGTTFTIFLPRDEHRIRLLKAHRPSGKTQPGVSP